MVSRIKLLVSTTALVSVIGVASATAASISINGPVTVNQVLNSGDRLIVTNAGAINVTTDAAVIVDGANANSIDNSGTIASTDFDAVKLSNLATVRQDLNNAGTIQGNFIGINLSNHSLIEGALNNSGLITGNNAAAINLNNGSKISGGIDNSGTVSGATGLLINGGSEVSHIVNSGLIAGTNLAIRVSSTSNVSGGITNTGTIDGVVNVGSASDISGRVLNKGTITGDEGFVVAGGDISGGIVNQGLISATGNNGISIIGGHISGGIVNSGTIQGPNSGIEIFGGGITGGITNEPGGTISGPGGAINIFFASEPVPILINGGHIIGDVFDISPADGFSRVTIGGDFSTQGNFDVSSVAITPGKTFTISSGNTLLTRKLDFQVNSATAFGKLVFANGPIDLSGSTVRAIVGPSTSLSDGAEMLVGDGTAPIVGGPGGTKTAVTDNSFLWDFEMADGTAASAPTDDTDLFLFVTKANVVGGGNGDVAEVLQSLDGIGDAVLQNAIDNMNNAPTQADVNNVLYSVQPPVDGGVFAANKVFADMAFKAVDEHIEALRSRTSGIASGNASRGLGQWGQVFGHTSSQGGSSTVGGYDAKTYGFALGVETVNGAGNSLAGVQIGYGQSWINSHNSNKTSTSDGNYQIALYGNYDFGPTVYARGMAAYNYNDVNTRRHDVGGLGGPTANGDYSADQFNIHTELGRRTNAQCADITTTVLANWLHLAPDGYTETGAGGANLQVHQRGMDLLELGAGVHATRTWRNSRGAELQPEAHAGYRYALIDDQVNDSSSFTGGGAAFSSQGIRPARSRLNAGVSMNYRESGGWLLSAGYDFEVREDYTAHAAKLRVFRSF